MAIVFNKTKHAIGILSREYSKVLAPDSSAEIPDDVAKAWSSKTDPRAMIDLGVIDVAETADIDLLIALHASETRKRVLSAIEVRMEELRADGIEP